MDIVFEDGDSINSALSFTYFDYLVCFIMDSFEGKYILYSDLRS